MIKVHTGRAQNRSDLPFKTSQAEFLPTKVEKLWKAINAKQIICRNVTHTKLIFQNMLNVLENKSTN